MAGKYSTKKLLELRTVISSYDLSKKLNLSYSSVRVIMSGHRKFSARAARIIEKLFPDRFKASDFRSDIFMDV